METQPGNFMIKDFVGGEFVIDDSPFFQRGDKVWKESDQQLLIDSLLNGYDVPKIYLHDVRDENADYSVIDGKQRITAIRSFHNNQFSLSKDFSFEGESIPPEGDAYVPQPKPGDRFSDFHRLWKKKFLTHKLQVVMVKAEDIAEVRELFTRLNKGKSLTGAEERRNIGGGLPMFTPRLIKHKFFRDFCVVTNNRLA